jgi:hypothetical protein
MMFKRMFAGHLFAATVVLGLASCGGGGGSNQYPISVAFSTAPPSSISIGTTASVAAIVSNDAANGGVNWSVTCSAGACGSFSPTSTANGDPTTYTPPSAVPSPASVTITATSVTDSTKKASASVTITAPSGPVLADGNYVFHLSGSDSNGPYTVAGVFTIAAGVISAGEQDFSDPNGGYTDPLNAKTSSLNTAGGNLQIVLDTGNSAIGVNGVETLRGTVVSATRVLLSEFDLTAAGTGALDLQTGTAAPAAGYAFAVSGNDTNGNPLAIGGILNFNGTALVTAGSVFDFSVFNSGLGSAVVHTKESFQSGSVTVPDAFGRVVITLTPISATGIPAFALAGYITGPNRIELVESAESGDLLNANTGGSALGQGANTGTFSLSSASVLNQSYAHGSGGVDPNGGAVFSGAFALNLNGILTGVLAVNDLSNIGAWTMGGTYAVDPTGRITVSVNSLTSGTAAAPATALTYELYLDGNGNAMVMGADTFQTSQGIAFEQGNTFTLAGNYALSGQGAVATTGGGVPWSAVGPVKVSSGSVTGYTDFTLVTLQPFPNVALTGTVNTANGTLSLAGLNPNSFTTSSGFGYYPLSGNRLWAIEVDNVGVSILLMEGVTP